MRRKVEAVLSSAALLSFLSLAGCTLGPKYHAPAAPQIAAPNYKESTVNFQNAPGWKVASPSDAMIRGNWWEVFHQPELNKLEEQLNINNYTLKQYFEQYMEARTLVAQARAQYWPTVTVNPAFSRTKSSGNIHNQYTNGVAPTSGGSTGSTGTGTAGGGTSTNAGQQSTLWSAPLDVSWAPDLWGKIRNEVRVEQYAAQVSAADLQNEKLTEQASLAEYYFEIRGQDMLQQILNDIGKADQAALEANQGAYDAGTGDYISVVEARATLQGAQSLAANVGIARAQYEHAIAVLLGKVPSDFSIPVRPAVYTPPPIPTGLPSQLLERRPDVAAAERTLAEANATIGIGYGAFFPQLSIAATGGFESSALQHIFDWPSRFWSIGPSASQILFDGGLYRAQLHQYQAAYNADLASYRQTSLVAFQQVEDGLAEVRIYSQQILREQEAVKSAQQYLDLENQRYQLGVDPYVDVVTAQNTLYNDEESLNSLQISQMLSAVQLVQALGGGWDATQLPTPSQAGSKAPKSAYALQK